MFFLIHFCALCLVDTPNSNSESMLFLENKGN